MATTTDGWPYVESSDHPLEYPAVSQQLANLLESRWDTYDASGLLVPTAPWAGLGALNCTRAGGMVTLEGTLTHTTGLTTVVGTTYAVGTAPVGFRPTVNRTATAVVWTGSAYAVPCMAEVQAGGQLRFIFTSAANIAANSGAVIYLLTFRGA